MRGEARPEGRPEGRTDNRSEGRGDRPPRDGRRNERPAEADSRPLGEAAATETPRRAPRPEREPRPQDLSDATAAPLLAEGGSAVEPHVGASARPDSLDAAGEEQRRRRRRRGGRGNRDDNGAEAGSDAQAEAAAPGTETPATNANDAASAGTAVESPGAEPTDRDGGRRRGRGRDRARRDEAPATAATDADVTADAIGTAATLDAAPSAVDAVVAALPAASASDAARAPVAADLAAEAPVEVTTQPVAAAAPAPVETAPVVKAFVLPLGDLQQVAESSGLQWVNSDREKIAAAQAAMAAEPAPIRVPRERKPVVASDAGPLVLVETKKDLSQLKLPFETAAAAGSATPQP